MYPWTASIFQQLTSRYAKLQLHHGLLFLGPSKLGKMSLCQDIAASLLCKTVNESAGSTAAAHHSACGQCKSCQLIAANSHPDLNIVISDKSQIGIDLIRNAITKLTQTAQLSGNKVLIIPNIELMSESASNALLKTLEEPTKNTYLLMTCNEPQKLLPTVLSRCEKIKVASPNYDQSVLWLSQQGVDTSSQAMSPSALQACGFSPIRYLEESLNDDALTYQNFVTDIEALEQGIESALRVAQKWKDDVPRALQWLSQYFMSKYKKDHAEPDFLSYQACIEKSKLMSHPGLNKVVLIESLLTRVSAIS
jgi:DNA polymerase-3 subunit delta'